MNKRILVSILLVMAMTAILAACSTSGSTPAESSGGTTSSSSIDAASLVDNNCAKCHSLDRLSEEKLTAAGWEKVVGEMDKKGNLGFSAEEKTAIAEYLAEKYQ